MKRIYMTLGLLAALGLGSTAYGQVADLESQVVMNQFTCLNQGSTIQPDSSNTTEPYGIWGVVNNGPDAIDSGSAILVIDPTCTLSDSGVSVLGYNTRYAPADSVELAISNLPVDSINSLLNIDSFNAGATQFTHLLVKKANFVDSATYGFYLYTIGVYSGSNINPNNPPDNTDTVKNNFVYVPIIWHCSGSNNTSIGDLIFAAARNVTIFPNPAKNVLNFRYGFIKNTKSATARVIDMTGRVLETKELGSQNIGTVNFNMNISSLPAGNYMLEVSTGYMNAVGKFTVSK